MRGLGAEIDLQKMPLGNLKKSQIQSGYEVLTSIQTVLETEEGDAAAGQRRKQKLTDLSNHFYTLVRLHGLTAPSVRTPIQALWMAFA
jgi:hypothetical protein